MNMIVTAIQEGGIWMYPIILTLVVAFAIAFERIFALMRFNMDGSALMAELQKSILGNQIDNASKTCQGGRPSHCHVIGPKHSVADADRGRFLAADAERAADVRRDPQHVRHVASTVPFCFESDTPM